MIKCSAKTMRGLPCSRRVQANGLCWQHNKEKAAIATFVKQLSVRKEVAQLEGGRFADSEKDVVQQSSDESLDENEPGNLQESIVFTEPVAIIRDEEGNEYPVRYPSFSFGPDESDTVFCPSHYVAVRCCLTNPHLPTKGVRWYARVLQPIMIDGEKTPQGCDGKTIRDGSEITVMGKNYYFTKVASKETGLLEYLENKHKETQQLLLEQQVYYANLA